MLAKALCSDPSVGALGDHALPRWMNAIGGATFGPGPSMEGSERIIEAHVCSWRPGD